MNNNMNTFNLIERFYKLMKEENKNNYKYNPIISCKKSFDLNSNKILSNNNNFIKTMRNIEKLNLTENKEKKEKNLSENKDHSNKKRRNKLENKRINLKKINSNKYNNINNKKLNYLNEIYCLKQCMINKKNYQKKLGNTKGFYTKNNCPFCQNKLIEKENNDNFEKEKVLLTDLKNFYRNKNFKDIRSCFIYSINNFPLIKKINNSYIKDELNDSEDKEKYSKTQNKWSKKVDMESELTKSNKVIKYVEIQRKEIDPTNLYLIKRPLIPSIRGKIIMNTRKRIGKPMRMILLDDES